MMESKKNAPRSASRVRFAALIFAVSIAVVLLLSASNAVDAQPQLLRAAPRKLALDSSRLTEVKNFNSNLLGNSRSIRIYVPPSYSSSPQQRYPVLYMHDGQNLFGAGGSFGSWAIENSVDPLATGGLINEVIVVGIDNTAARTNEYNYGDGAYVERYSQFVIQEVIPFVNAQYRTQTGPENTAIIGSSFGGMASLYFAWYRSDIFGMAGCLSPTLAWANFQLYNEIKSYQGPKKPVKLWIYAGDSEKIDPDGNGLFNYGTWSYDLVHTLHQKGWTFESDLMFSIGAGGIHNEKSWSEYVRSPIQFFFRKDQATALTPQSLSARVTSSELDADLMVKTSYLLAEVIYSNGIKAHVPFPALSVDAVPVVTSQNRVFRRFNIEKGVISLQNNVTVCNNFRRRVNLNVGYRGLSATTFFEVIKTSPTKSLVTFTVTAPTNDANSNRINTIYVVGDFGGWSFINAALPLTKLPTRAADGSPVFQASFVFKRGQSLAFKFVAGLSFDYEEVQTNGAAIQNRVLTVSQTSDKTSFDAKIAKWKAVP